MGPQRDQRQQVPLGAIDHVGDHVVDARRGPLTQSMQLTTRQRHDDPRHDRDPNEDSEGEQPSMQRVVGDLNVQEIPAHAAGECKRRTSAAPLA